MTIGIRDGLPIQSGLYVAYTNDGLLPNFAARQFLVWDNRDSRWYHQLSDQRYRGHVYGWIGPIPAMRLED